MFLKSGENRKYKHSLQVNNKNTSSISISSRSSEIKSMQRRGDPQEVSMALGVGRSSMVDNQGRPDMQGNLHLHVFKLIFYFVPWEKITIKHIQPPFGRRCCYSFRSILGKAKFRCRSFIKALNCGREGFLCTALP